MTEQKSTYQQALDRYAEDYGAAFSAAINDHLRRRGDILAGRDPRQQSGRYAARGNKGAPQLLRGEGRRWAFAERAFNKEWEKKWEREYNPYRDRA